MSPRSTATCRLDGLCAAYALPRFRRGTITQTGGTFTVFLMTHPAHGGWDKTHRALIASLKAKPA